VQPVLVTGFKQPLQINDFIILLQMGKIIIISFIVIIIVTYLWHAYFGAFSNAEVKLQHTQVSTYYKHAKVPSQVNTHTQPFYDSLDFVLDNPGEPVPEETFTHSHVSWSSVIRYLLPPSVMIHGILPVQFTCLTVFFHNLQVFLVYLLAWHPELHTPYISSPNHCLLFTAHGCFAVEIMSFNPSLSLNPLLVTLL